MVEKLTPNTKWYFDMKVGFDYGGVLDTHSNIVQMAVALKYQGHETYLVSAVRIGDNNANRFGQELEAKFPGAFTEVVVIECPNWDSHPRLKLHALNKRGIEMFFDDREDTNILLRHHGILGLTVKGLG